MLSQKDRQERGQAILLMAVAMVGMLGFAAVALDGGNIYAEQRRAQSAADNAVLAGAYQYMRGITVTSTISNAALANAALNDYDNNSTSNWVKFYRPPISGSYVGNTSYMQVVITERVPTALAHLVYQGPFQLTVSAIGYAKTGGPPVDGNAIVALSPHGCSIVIANGNGSVATTGGGIFANSDGSADPVDGNPGQCNGGNTVLDGGAHAFITSAPPYGINVVDPNAGTAYDGSVSPQPTAGVSAIPSDPLSDLEAPDCPTAGTTSDPTSGTINPGYYNSLNATGTLVLNPGIYCINDNSIHAVDIGAHGVLTGTGVMLYLKLGGMHITQGTFNIQGPSTTYNPTCASINSWDAPNTSVCHYLGMVIYVDRTNTNEIDLEGQAGWSIGGTIYAPNSQVRLDGNGDWSLTGQVLANNFVTEGNGAMAVNFDPNVIYVPAPAISLMQ